MSEALATPDELETRLGWTFSEGERTMAEAVLSDVSAIVRAYGLPWPDPATVPDVVRTVTLAVAERKMRNPEGYRSETEGSYQYHLPAAAASGLALTVSERALIRTAAGFAGVYSVPISSFGGPV